MIKISHLAIHSTESLLHDQNYNDQQAKDTLFRNRLQRLLFLVSTAENMSVENNILHLLRQTNLKKNRVINYVDYLEKVWEKIWKAWVGLFFKFVCQGRCSILFSTLMFMPVVPAILTRNKRRCSRFRNSVSLACWSQFWSCYKDSVLSIAKCELLIIFSVLCLCI